MTGKRRLSFVMAVVAVISMIGTDAAYAADLSDGVNDGQVMVGQMAADDIFADDIVEDEEEEDEDGDMWAGDEDTEPTESAVPTEPAVSTEPSVPVQPPADSTESTDVYQPGTLKDMEVTYDLEDQLLIVDWNGEDIAQVDIYLDDVKLGTTGGGDIFSAKMKLEPMSKHVCRLVALSKDTNLESTLTQELRVDANKAVLDGVSVDYDETKKQLVVSWDGQHVKYVEISLNDETLTEKYPHDEYTLNYVVLQPGASYQVTVTPYNEDNVAGDEVAEPVNYGEFVVPLEPELELGSTPVVGENGRYTGFYRPMVTVTIEAQPGARYEIYRAKRNKKSKYNWIASVKATEDGICKYIDQTVGIGHYYYKVMRRISADTYVEQDLYTALSDSSNVDIVLPKATVQAELLEKGLIQLSMKADSDIVSGYVIYRRTGSGKYKKIATVSGNMYEDTDIVFDERYHYKVRAYYYDTLLKKKVYGPYSAVENIRNTIGSFSATVKEFADGSVKISWDKAANAEGYEVYYKTTTKGASYEFLASTTGLSLKKQLNSRKDYKFLIKAYTTREDGKTYFSEAEVTVDMGFTSPKNLQVKKVVYVNKGKEKTLTQKTYLSWNTVYGADGYYLEKYNPATKKYVKVAELTKASKTKYTLTETVTSTVAETQYRVRAYHNKRKKASETVTVSTRLGTPQNVRVKTQQSSAKIRWKRVKGADMYRVYRSNGRNAILVGETTKLSFTDKKLDVGIDYGYYVQAINKQSNYSSANSEIASCSITFSKVTGLKAKNTAEREVQLSWKRKSDVKSYVIYYATEQGGEYKKLAEAGNEINTYVHKKLEKETTYYYKVTAIQENCIGVSVESNAASVSITTK